MLKISSSLKILLVLAPMALALQAHSSLMSSFAMPSDLVKLSPEQLQSRLEPVTYSGLYARALVRVNRDVKPKVNSRTEFIIIGEGYEAELEFASYKDAKDAGNLREGDFLRVIYASLADSIVVSNVGTGAWEHEQQEEKNIQITFIRVDKNLKPIGEMFVMKTKVEPSEEVDIFDKVAGEFLSAHGPLRYDRALSDDILVNMLDQKIGGLTLPANTRALVKSVSWKRIGWTFNYKYTLNLQLIDCPEAFKKLKCKASISGNGGFPNETWAHKIATKNERKTTILGLEVHY